MQGYISQGQIQPSTLSGNRFPIILHVYKSYPKLVGETGGKDFIFAHSSADPLELATAIVRGSFEYQGQKCSAASRAYIPESIWNEYEKAYPEDDLRDKNRRCSDFRNYVNAVIDNASFEKIMSYIDKAKSSA